MLGKLKIRVPKMARTKTDMEDVVLKVLSARPGGARISSLEEAIAAAGIEVSRRTLQRCLARMEKAGAVLREGRSVAANYALPHSETPFDLTSLKLSTKAAEVRDAVSLPTLDKNIATWNPDFLESYEPNATHFLDREIRTQLHDMGRTGPDGLPAGTHLRDVLGQLTIDLSWASSRLEGNRYSRIDTEQLIRFGKHAEGKDLEDTRMILNHKSAIEMIAENPDQIGYDRYTFMNIHAQLSEDMMSDPAASGRLRKRPVDIGGSVFVPLAIPRRIEEAFDMILDKAERIADPFEASFFLLAQIPYLQPFEDMNKRVSRLGANIPLIKANMSPLSFFGIPEAAYFQATQAVYEFNRTEYLAEVYLIAYERSCQRYAAIKNSAPPPDPIRLRYREEIRAMVRDSVLGVFEGPQEYLGSSDIRDHGARLAEILEQEVEGLHEGNILRYGLRMSQFQAWKDGENRGRT